MQRKFKLFEPKKDSIAKWVTLSSDSQNTSNAGSPRITLSSVEHSVVNIPNYDPIPTPKSIKVSRSPVFFKDDMNVPNKTRRPKQKSSSSKSANVQAPTIDLDSQNVTPKIIFSPGIVRDTKDWRLDTTRSSKPNLNSLEITQRSVISGSGTGIDYLDSSRILFKPEMPQNVDVNNWVTIASASNIVFDEDFRIPPTFSARTDEASIVTENMSGTVLQQRKQVNMSNTVGESRKEIEKLKSELESLINTNLKNKNIIPQQNSVTNVENSPTVDSLNNVTSVKQNVIVSPSKTSKSPSSIRRKSSTLITDTNVNKEESKSKGKTYDQESTREFIKKQKLRRKEKLQQEELQKKESEIFKKQKLEELRQKTLQLLTLNVKKCSSKKISAKPSGEKFVSKSNDQLVNNIQSSQHLSQNRKLRARSFDREANKNSAIDDQENVDKTKDKPWRRARSVSRELKFCDKKSPVKTRKSLVESKSNSKFVNSNPDVELAQVVNQISELDNKKDEAATKIQAAFRGYQQRIKSINNSDVTENIPSKSRDFIAPSTDNNHSENNIVNDIKLKCNIPSQMVIKNVPLSKYNTNIPSVENDVMTKSAIPSTVNRLEEIIKNIPNEVIKSLKNSELQEVTTTINGITQNNDIATGNRNKLTEIEAIKQKLETSISQSSLENKRNETPDWLLPPTTLPYPYNFISAVRKKLEIATKSHNNITKDVKLQSPSTEKFTKDTSIQTVENKRKFNVSVQCSIENNREIKEPKIPEIVPPKPDELKTFMSHKCRKQLVYDSPPKLKSPTNIKDISKEISRKEKTEHKSVKSKSKTTLTSETSDSDTTKNVPEISEEEQFSKHISENLKNITFHRPKSAVSNEKDFTFDQIKVDKNSSKQTSTKLSIKSEHSDRLKNITFDCRSNSSFLDVSNLIKPEFKVDTSKISKHSNEQKSNRSKYPSDIESILSQYSKMKLSSKSNIHNDSHNSQYSEDFNSSFTNHLSLPSTKSNNAQIQQDSSLDFHTDSEIKENNSKARTSDLSKIKSEILVSLARKHSSSLSNIPKQISESLTKHSEIITNNSTDIYIDSLNKVSNGSQIVPRKTNTRNIAEFNLPNTENKSKNSTTESLNKHSSRVFEIKSNNTCMKDRNIPEINSKISELSTNSTGNNLESLNKYSSKLISENTNIKTKNSGSNIESQTKYASNDKSGVSDTTSKNSFIVNSNISQTKTTPSNNMSHSKKEESGFASSIPEDSVAFGTNLKSAQKSNIIKSLINESLTKETKSGNNDSTIRSMSEIFENSESKSLLKSLNYKSLSKPAVNLKIEKEKFFRETKNNPNQIHLKFQAEVHLLNSFNNSLQQVVAVEKSLLDIRDSPPVTTVNFTRGCGAPDQMESLSILESSVCSQDLDKSRMSESVASETAAVTDRSALSETCNSVVSQRENIITKNPYVGVSLGMYDQMIRDEDNRLEHLKAILKLRDKALFDRTKGELAWLEIQKKQLRENGQLNDVTIIKKKQRGLIIKLEQERHEMQRLKQAHKQAAKERKNALREQKNIIKQQLSSTDQIPTKIRRLSHLERRQSGPVKVYRVESRTEHVKETTMSKNSSGTDETISVTTSSVVTQISEKVSVDHSDRPETSLAVKPYPRSTVSEKDQNKTSDKHSEKVKRALLMKEADLEKRRKEAEELLKWHERLKQEEAQVVELERQAKSIQLDDYEKKRVLSGAQLNKIWKGITGSTERKFDDHKKYQMSKRSLDKFYQNARKIFKEISEERNSFKRGSEESYTSDFDPSHSPSKINLSSSIMTQINETDLSISPNKMLSERLRQISESSRVDFITSSKTDTSVSEHTTFSEKSPLSSNKKSSLSKISSADQQAESESNIQTVKDSSVHSSEDKYSSRSSVISELNIISDQETVTSKKSVQSEMISRKSSIESEIPELNIISENERNKLSDIKSLEKKVRYSITDSEPELKIVSELEQNNEDDKYVQTAVEQSKNISTDSDLPELDLISEHDINSDNLKSPDTVESITKKSSKSIKISDSLIKSEYEKKFEQIIPSDLQSFEENRLSEEETQKSETIDILSEVSNEEKKSECKITLESASLVVSLNNTNEPSKINSNQIISETDNYKLSSDLSHLENKTDEHFSEEPEENIISEKPTPKADTNILFSFKDIISRASEQIKSELSQNIKSEDNTSKIVDESILSSSYSYVPSDLETKSDNYTSSDIEISKKIISTAEDSVIKSNLEESRNNKSPDVQITNTIQSHTLVDENKSNNESNSTGTKSEISSEENVFSARSASESEQNYEASEHSATLVNFDHISDDKKSVISEHTFTKTENIIFDLLGENYPIKSTEMVFQISENQDSNIEFKEEQITINSENRSNIQEESEIIQSFISEKSGNSILKSPDENVALELVNLKTSTKLDVSETQDQNIQSEVSTPRHSESYQTDFERITNTETDQKNKESIRETDTEKYFSDSEPIEITDTINSSATIKTEKETVTKIESRKSDSDTKDNSKSFESENESETIMESPKSVQISPKENDAIESKSQFEENSEVLFSPSSESQVITNLSKKSISTDTDELVEENKENSEHSIELQNEDANIAGVSHIDVRKRVSEILADTTTSRGDKSPRLQDLYVTTYDVMTNSPESTPETGSPTNEYNKRDKSSFSIETPYRSEAEELLRKQLEIEQEIKQLERQQQQQNIPYLFMREIPNKPPPPYKPPNATVTPVINSVIPVHADQIRKFVSQSADVLYQAYVIGNLKDVSYESNEVDKVNSQKFVFDLCKEIALEVCKPMEITKVPSWRTQKNKFQTLISRRPVNKDGLYSVMNRKVLQLLNFEPVVRKDNLIIRWSRKKRDHVDEILVLESQTEETEWTNYDSDEQTIKDNLTSDIMDLLILETAQVMCENMKKNKKMSWINYC